MNSSVLISQEYRSPDFIYLLAYILEVANVHKICYYTSDTVIAVEDWNQKLNITHLDFIHHIVNSEASATPVRMSLPKTSSVTTLYVNHKSHLLEYVRKNLEFFHHLNRFCIDTTTKWYSIAFNEVYEVLYPSSKATGT